MRQGGPDEYNIPFRKIEPPPLSETSSTVHCHACHHRAGCVSTAKAAFEGESLIAVSWSGNYEQVFRETIIDPFNAKYDTKAETVGGWDQIVSQIKAAPEDNPPFDVTVAEEYISSAGLAESLYMKTDKSKIPNLDAVYPWFYETRPDKAKEYGIPFGGGTCMLLSARSWASRPTSWGLLWDERLAGKVTSDSAAWWWTLSVPAVMSQVVTGLDEMYDMATAEALFAELDKLKVAKWYKDGAEQANLLNQEEADAAMSYSSDAYTFLTQSPDEYVAACPEGRRLGLGRLVLQGARHQAQRSGRPVHELPAGKGNAGPVPVEVHDFHGAQGCDGARALELAIRSPTRTITRCFQIITMDGWDKINANYQAFDDRMKQTMAKTSGLIWSAVRARAEQPSRGHILSATRGTPHASNPPPTSAKRHGGRGPRHHRPSPRVDSTRPHSRERA